MASPSPAPLMDVRGCAARLGIKEKHLRTLVYERRIPYIKVGGSLRFDPARIDQWLAENTHEAAS